MHFHYRRIAKGVARRATVQERRLQREIEGEDRIEKPEYDRLLVFDALKSTGIGQPRLILSGRGIVVKRNDAPILDGIDVELRGGDRVWLSGSNGSGKTTLLEVLAGAQSTGGEVLYGTDVNVGYLRQEHFKSTLAGDFTVLDSMRSSGAGEESALRAILDQFLFTGHDVKRRVVDLSYGERLRLEIARIIASGASALLLDEPTNHLDLPGIERLQFALASYRGPLVVVSHDRAFLQGLALSIEWPLQNGTIVPRFSNLA